MSQMKNDEKSAMKIDIKQIFPFPKIYNIDFVKNVLKLTKDMLSYGSIKECKCHCRRQSPRLLHETFIAFE